MTAQVTVPLPLNISDKELHLFKPYCSYEIARQEVKLFKDIFFTFSGFCVNERGLIRECHHNYPQQYEGYVGEVARYYYDVVVHPQNLIRLEDDRTYLAIHHPWFNYFHWITESIFRLWIARHELDRLVLLLPEYYAKTGFIMESLEPFRIKTKFFIPGGKSLMVKNLCLPQIKPICDSYNKAHIRQVRDFYVDYVLSHKKMSPGKTERLYVSRQFAGRRQVVGEEKIVAILKKHGFTIFYPEHFSFLEQVAIFAGVKYLVGMHGSGLTNMLFMQKGASLFEFHKDRTNELDHPSPLFWYMAEALELNYYHQSCETYGKEDYFTGDYLVDAALFEQNLQFMLSNRVVHPMG